MALINTVMLYQREIPTPSPVPTATPMQLPSAPGFQNTENQTKSSSAIPVYQAGSLTKDLERITQRENLGLSDLSTKNNLISSLDGNSGIVMSTSEYQVEYVKTADSFMIELLSLDANGAKRNAHSWFQQQGFTDKGICDLPVVFYLSPEVLDYYKNSGLEFNPIPEGCQ